MESKLDNFKDKHERLGLKHTFLGGVEDTQLGYGGEYNVLLNQRQFSPVESLQNERNKRPDYETEKNITNLVDNSVFGSTKVILKEDNGYPLRSDGERYLYLLNNFQRSGPMLENYNTNTIQPNNTKDDINPSPNELMLSVRKNHKTKNNMKLNNNNKYLLQKTMLPIKRGSKGLRVNETVNRDFSNICDALTANQELQKYPNEGFRMNNLVTKKDLKTRKLNMEEEDKNKQSEVKKRRVGRPSKYVEVDSDSSSTILSTTSSNVSNAMESEYREEVEERQNRERRGRKKKDDYKPSEEMEKYLNTINGYSARTLMNRIKNKMDKPKTKLEQKEKINKEMFKKVEEKNIVDNLDKIEGVKYEPGLVDLRRKYKSFEQLCFGLGCIVGPTKQELQMCTELLNLGDESCLSRYETSVYQSCLLRTKAFENVWRKFCNKVVEIIRKYIIEGINKLMKVIEYQDLVHPFVKVVMLDIAIDRQDQELFLNIIQEEMEEMISEKYMIIRINTNMNNIVDDAIKQMYIHMNKVILISKTRSINEEDKKNELKNEYEEEMNKKIRRIGKHEEGKEENVLEKLIKLYNTKFREKELIIIIHKLNHNVNEILYLFQMLKRKRLIEIKSLLLVCTNNEYLEKYCDTRIYSNLGIFQCNMLTVSNLVDEMIQVIMYDEKVQDFIANYEMMGEIYGQFYNQDYSLTLFIIRIYQLYEEYYKKNIFSYLSIVPTKVVDWEEDKEEENRKKEMLNKPPGYNPNKVINQEFWEKKDNEEILLPLESLIKEKETRDPTKMSDVSTTTSTISSSMESNNNMGMTSMGDTMSELTSHTMEENQNVIKMRGDYSMSNVNGKGNGTKIKFYESSPREKEINKEDWSKKLNHELKELRGRRREKEKKEVVKREVLERERAERVGKAKSLYSIYSLLCISNNMSDNYIAYLELKLGIEMELEKIVLEYLPLNTLILLQRRILFQLGVNLLYKLLVFMPDSYTVNKRINHLIMGLPPFSQSLTEGSREDKEKNMKDLLKRLFKYVNMKCNISSPKQENVRNLIKIIREFNKVYKTGIQPVINIEMFLEGEGTKVKEENETLKIMNTLIDETLEGDELIEEVKNKLNMCFFPSITKYKLSNIMGIQSYTSTFKTEVRMSPIISISHKNNQIQISKIMGNPQQGSKLRKSISSMKQDKQGGGEDVIMYIYKYIKYKIINMWKLFIIYYYIMTSKYQVTSRENQLVEVYIRFNINVEMLEKIYKIILVTHNNNTITSRETSNILIQKNIHEEDEAQLCYLIKSSMSNINVKFL